MRILEFEVNKQTIRKKPDCDFSGLVAGTRGYLRAKFTFSADWDGCRKAASFWRGGKEYAVLLDQNACEIPAEVLTGGVFEVSVTGRKRGLNIPSNRVRVKQEVQRNGYSG